MNFLTATIDKKTVAVESYIDPTYFQRRAQLTYERWTIPPGTQDQGSVITIQQRQCQPATA
jgi:hypothetical protein